MNKKIIIAGSLLLTTGLVAAPFASLASTTIKAGAAKVGEMAPSWRLFDTAGKPHSLKDYAGKYVVLEWTNPGCPYVQKHYRTGNMQATQKFAISHGAVWFSVNSSAKGRGGNDEGWGSSAAFSTNATGTLLDPRGEVGREFGAKSTPDIMIINPKGVLIYSGAIDDKPTTDDADVKTAHNYVRAALSEAMAGKAVLTPVSQPYGCGIKYSAR